jgi:cell division protein FtsB
MRSDTRATGRLGRWSVRLALAGGTIALLACAPRLFAGGSRLDRLSSDVARAHATIAARKATLAAKRARVRALKQDPGVIEDIARDELGMIYPGELVLRVERDR